jgi:hypothetical protein
MDHQSLTGTGIDARGGGSAAASSSSRIEEAQAQAVDMSLKLVRAEEVRTLLEQELRRACTIGTTQHPRDDIIFCG